MNEKFVAQLRELKEGLNDEQEQMFEQYYDLLIEWNNKLNLTRITSKAEVYEKHFLDSIAVTKIISLRKPHKLIDIGTGAGFPGIPLKIMYPELEVLLLDSLGKRVSFLDEVIKILELKSIRALKGRAEDLARDTDYRKGYDVAVSRAVANLAILSEYNLPFLKLGGSFVAYKSESVSDELGEAKNAIKTLGGKIQKVEKFYLPKTNISRTFIIIEKVNETPEKYPRRAGIPEKRPL